MTMRESPQGMEASIGCAAGDGMGGGIFAKTAKTPPLQSGVCGDGIAIPMLAIAASMPHMETLILYNDAARRVATSSEKRENRV